MSTKKRVSQLQEQAKQEFHHAPKKSVQVLTEAGMTQKGVKYWEQKESFDHPSVEWWQLKSAKDFETGVGQKLYRHGTLSTWSDSQVKSLIDEMQKTINMANEQKAQDNAIKQNTKKKVKKSVQFDPDMMFDDNNDNNNNNDGNNDNSGNNGDSGDVSAMDFMAEIKKQKQKQQNDDNVKKSKAQEYIKKIKKMKQDQKNNASDDENFEVKQINSIDDIAGKFDEEKMRGNNNSVHRRTRTEALRFKLADMEQRLEAVTTDLTQTENVVRRKSEALESAENKSQEYQRKAERADILQNELLSLKGALGSAQTELSTAEEQILHKDQEIMNLKKELSITKQLNNELTQSALSDTGLTADDILAQRMKDANRFAFMLAAMQEQLEFERKQFTKRINTLELQLEHKDVQINTLYTLYNKLVKQTTKKSWWQKMMSNDE